MKKTISLLLALVLCLSLCACGGKKIDSLMNGFEWGQTYAQAQKNMDNKDNFTVLGRKIQGVGCHQDKDEPLNQITYTIMSDSRFVDSSNSSSPSPYSTYRGEFENMKKSLIEMFGDPSNVVSYDTLDKIDYRAVWYVDDDIVTLIYSGWTSYGYASYTEYYSLTLGIEHTTA